MIASNSKIVSYRIGYEGKEHFGFLHTCIQLKKNKVKKMQATLQMPMRPVVAFKMPPLHAQQQEPCYIRYVREGNGMYRKEEVNHDHTKSYLELYREVRGK